MKLRSTTIFSDLPSDALLAANFPPMDGYSIIRRHCEEVLAACKDKEVADLTETEKFAIAFIAGVPLAARKFDMRLPSNRLTFTTVPCAIVKIDGKFHVACDTRKP